MGKIKDFSGQRFGRLLVLRATAMRTSHRNVIFECLCDCGNTVYVSGGCLRSGKIKSCGCYRIDHMRENRNEGFTHRLSQSRLYSVWSSIKCRCKNQSHPSYRNYGAKGITICEEWDNDFMEFYQWAMQTGYDENSPKGSCTIDRIDYTKGYCPENCRWISLQEQSLNRKCNRYIDFNGQKMTISQWSQQTGIHPGTIRYRIDAGWDVSEALTKIPN